MESCETNELRLKNFHPYLARETELSKILLVKE